MNNHSDKYGTLLPDLGELLEESRTENNYQMQFDIEYVLEPRYALAANSKLVELGLARDSFIVEGPRIVAKLVGKGSDGLENIIKFDGWLSLTKALDSASAERIALIDSKEKSPLGFLLKKLFKKPTLIPSNSFIEADVKSIYRAHGIEI